MYGMVILVNYLGVESWISLMIHLFMTKFPTFANAVRWNRDSVPLIVIIPYTVSLLAMVTFLVPYVMARSHLTVSLIREMGFYGDTVTVIFTALSSYGFLWNLTDKLKGETAQAKTN